MTVAILIDGLAFDVFHDEVGQTSFGRAAIEQASNVWMSEAGENLTFIPKAGENEICIHATPDDLDSYLLFELIIVARRQVNSAHPAATDFSIDLIKPNVLADHRLGLIFDEQLRGVAENRLLNESFRLFM